MRTRTLFTLVIGFTLCAAGCSAPGPAPRATSGSMTQGDSIGNFVTGQMLRSSSKSLNDPARSLATAAQEPEQD